MNEEQKKWTDDSEMMDRYLRGELSDEERVRLEQEIEGDAERTAALRTEMEITAGIRRHGREQMKAGLRTALRKDRQAQFLSFNYIGLAAAVVIVLIGVGVYKYFFNDYARPTSFPHPKVYVTVPDDTSDTAEATADTVQEQVKEPSPPSPAADAMAMKKERKTAEVAANNADHVPSEATMSAAPATASGYVAKTVESTAAMSVADASGSVWLVGNVVMVRSERVDASELSKRSASGVSASSEEFAAGSSAPAKRKIALAAVEVRRRPVKELPAARRSKDAGTIETLVERKDDHLIVTLYNDDVRDGDVKEAVVLSLGEDSLVVSLPSRSIGYRLPAGWVEQARTR